LHQNAKQSSKDNIVFAAAVFIVINTGLLIFATLVCLWLYRGIIAPRLAS
jgi:hypothetical protein